MTPLAFLELVVNQLDSVHFRVFYPSPLYEAYLKKTFEVLARNGTAERLNFALSIIKNENVNPMLFRESALGFSACGVCLLISDKYLFDGVLQTPSDVYTVLSNAIKFKQSVFISWFVTCIKKEMILDKTIILSLLHEAIEFITFEAFDALLTLRCLASDSLINDEIMEIFEKLIEHECSFLMPLIFKRFNGDEIQGLLEARLLALNSPEWTCGALYLRLPLKLVNEKFNALICNVLAKNYHYSYLKHYVSALSDAALVELLKLMGNQFHEDDQPEKWDVVKMLLPRMPALNALCDSYYLSDLAFVASLHHRFELVEALYRIECDYNIVKNANSCGKESNGRYISVLGNMFCQFIDCNQIEALTRVCVLLQKYPDNEHVFLRLFRRAAYKGNQPILELLAGYLTVEQVSLELNPRDKHSDYFTESWPLKISVLSALTGANKPSQQMMSHALQFAAQYDIEAAVTILCDMTSDIKPSNRAVWDALSVAKDEKRIGWASYLRRPPNKAIIQILESSIEMSTLKFVFFGSRRKRSASEAALDAQIDEFLESRPGF